MSNLIDADAGTERFGGYEAELKLVQADLSQQIEQQSAGQSERWRRPRSWYVGA
jgi:hypothetical protein